MKFYLAIIFSVLLSAQAIAQEADKSFLNIYDKYWEIEDGYYRVMQHGKIGLVNQSGDVIIPCENEQVWNLQENGNIKVLKNGKLGIYNLSGDLIIPPVYEMIWTFSDGYARVLRNGKIGYVNTSGNEIIPCKYDQIWTFEDGKAKVLKNGKTGFVNSSGYEFIPCEYQKIWDFEDGKARVLKNGKMGYISIQGVELIPCEYQHIGEFNDGVAKAVLNGKIIYIDTNGNPVNPIIVEDVTDQADTVRITTIEVDNPKIKIENGDTTVIKIFGSKIAVIEEDGSKEFSFDSNNRDKHEYKRNRHRRFKGHYWGVDLGFNNYLNANGEISLPDEYHYLSLSSAKSVEVSVNALQQNIGLGRNVGFVTGLGLTYNNYRFDKAYIPNVDDNGNLIGQEITDPYEKNKLMTLYLTAPLLFEVQMGRNRFDSFYMSAGAVGGIRLQSHTKIMSKHGGDKTKTKNRDSFGLNDFRYGAQVRFGFKSLNFYGTYYFSPMYDKDKGPELYPISVGISFYPGTW
ncbi:WG repeat-containing protein [Labilibacter marinus]|uniref:WG repeat-containing protein n=1 Tax=Labilibacter marinus TaxID=1477105 RepID=UPI00094FEF6F|nr:WG repeat-containing protein [Labilibacter marinus]